MKILLDYWGLVQSLETSLLKAAEVKGLKVPETPVYASSPGLLLKRRQHREATEEAAIEEEEEEGGGGGGDDDDNVEEGGAGGLFRRRTSAERVSGKQLELDALLGFCERGEGQDQEKRPRFLGDADDDSTRNAQSPGGPVAGRNRVDSADISPLESVDTLILNLESIDTQEAMMSGRSSSSLSRAPSPPSDAGSRHQGTASSASRSASRSSSRALTATAPDAGSHAALLSMAREMGAHILTPVGEQSQWGGVSANCSAAASSRGSAHVTDVNLASRRSGNGSMSSVTRSSGSGPWALSDKEAMPAPSSSSRLSGNESVRKAPSSSSVSERGSGVGRSAETHDTWHREARQENSMRIHVAGDAHREEHVPTPADSASSTGSRISSRRRSSSRLSRAHGSNIGEERSDHTRTYTSMLNSADISSTSSCSTGAPQALELTGGGSISSSNGGSRGNGSRRGGVGDTSSSSRPSVGGLPGAHETALASDIGSADAPDIPASRRRRDRKQQPNSGGAVGGGHHDGKQTGGVGGGDGRGVGGGSHGAHGSEGMGRSVGDSGGAGRGRGSGLKSALERPPTPAQIAVNFSLISFHGWHRAFP